MQIPIVCLDCGATGAVGRITANLQCRCGSTKLGMDGVDNVTEPQPSNTDGVQPEHEDMNHMGGLSREAMQLLAAGGTGWIGPDPRRYDGLSEYAGPTPQVVHRNPPVAQENQGVCPVCHGSGRDPVSDRSACRECGGTGQAPMSPTGGPNPQFGETRDAPGRALPAGGAHWASSSGETHVCQHCHRTTRGEVMPTQVGWACPHCHKSNKTASATNSGFTTESMAMMAGKVAPGSPEDVIRSSTPGYGERGYAGPAAGSAPFNPRDERTFYPSMPNTSPHVKTREDHNYDAPAGPYRMDQASCPNCGTRPTELVKDKNEDAWWHCSHCGPLANIDKHPEINPYSPPAGFTPDRSMKTGGFLARNRKTGRLMSMLATIHAHNDLGETEAVTLARESIARYGEGR